MWRDKAGFLTPHTLFLLHGGGGGLRWPSRSNARASGPLWLRNDVKRSGNRLVAGSFDRFVNYAHRLER
jgi:hypothetical protein